MRHSKRVLLRLIKIQFLKELPEVVTDDQELKLSPVKPFFLLEELFMRLKVGGCQISKNCTMAVICKLDRSASVCVCAHAR
jgi:hypothetical protein